MSAVGADVASSGGWHRVAAVVRLELLIQRREPLSVLYVLVLGLLSMAFAAAGPVELVRNRGAIPRDAAWSVMLACTALTAFGQVITTMVAATVVLRDRADRVADLLTVSRLSPREYLLGKLLAALGTLCVIYAAIPVGLLAGAMLGGGQAAAAVRAVVPPFVLLVLPTMLAVGALQFSVGVLSGRLWAIVGQGLILIWLWSASVDAAAVGKATGVASLLDPFGSAPLLAATRHWSDAMRTTSAMPVTAVLLWNRALWLGLGAAAALLAIVRGQGGVSHARSRTEPRRRGHAEPTPAVGLLPIVRAGTGTGAARGVLAGAGATARYVARWMWRDTGWRVLTALGAVNVGVHVALESQVGASPAALAMQVVQATVLHARLFLILLATIYAGELVWREREERSAPLFDAQPVRNGALLLGRVSGVIAAQLIVVVLLLVTASVAAMLGTGGGIDAGRVLLDGGLRVGVPFVGWLLVALAVHAVIQQKVAAHLLLIAGWVVAVLAANAATAPPDGVAVWRWVLVAPVALLVSGLAWVRGARRGGEWRRVLPGASAEKS